MRSWYVRCIIFVICAAKMLIRGQRKMLRFSIRLGSSPKNPRAITGTIQRAMKVNLRHISQTYIKAKKNIFARNWLAKSPDHQFPFWHRNSGDLNDVSIDPAEDWSQVRWSRDHFLSRKLIFSRVPRPNFEIASRGGLVRYLDFQELMKKLIWTHHPIQFFASNSNLQSKSAQNRPRTWFWPIFEKIDLSCQTKYGHETFKNLRSLDTRLGIRSCTHKTQFYMVSDRFW